MEKYPPTKQCQIIPKSCCLASNWAPNPSTCINRIPTVYKCHDEYTGGDKGARPHKSLLFNCTDKTYTNE